MTASPCGAAVDTVDMASDGAVTVNADWEAGKRSTWFIEMQRAGTSLIENGVAREDNSLIQQGCLCLDWGFNKEAGDGSFPGTADAFHSESLFIDAAAQAVVLLNNYNPVATGASTTYARQKAAQYLPLVHQGALWLAMKGSSLSGRLGDVPYTHRRYILANTLQDVGQITGDQSLEAAALPYILDGLSLQEPNGINPEQGGFDVNYQDAGIIEAEHYYAMSTNSTIKARLVNMINRGLRYDSKYINQYGAIDIANSTREGKELNRDGTVKMPVRSDIRDTYLNGAVITKNNLFNVVAARLVQQSTLPTSDKIASDGSVAYNTTWETGGRTKWAAGAQRIGAQWIETGIQTENDAYIREGIKILMWTAAHQAADGSFPSCSTPFQNTAYYVEAAARSSRMIANYNPSTYAADASYYQNAASQLASSAEAGANWMLSAVGQQAAAKEMGSSTSLDFVVGAAYAQSSNVSGSNVYSSAATSYLNTGLNAITSSGVGSRKRRV